MVQKYTEKLDVQNKTKERKPVRLWGACISKNEERRTIEQRVTASVKAKIRKQNKTNVNVRRIQIHATCGYPTMATEPARARLL